LSLLDLPGLAHRGPLSRRGSTDVWVAEPRGAGWLVRAQEVWRHRRLLSYFASETVRRTYQSTVLGKLWLLIRPLFPVLIGTFLFHEIAGIQSGETPYFLFFLVGTAIWSLFQECAMWATRSIQLYRKLLTRVYFPRIILPLATMAPALVHFGIHVLLILAVSLYFLAADGRFYLHIGPEVVFALIAFAMALAMSLSIGLFTSVLGAEKRDVRFTLGYILQLWFFVTPVVYPISIMPEQWRWLATINPMSIVLELFRWGVLGTPAAMRWIDVASAVGILLVVLALGLRFFIKAEASAVDRL
jgi:lipopolysaccharide transport system permease protein